MKWSIFLLLVALPICDAAERKKRANDAAPSVQMLVPGFVVSELPVTLTNAVNLQYRHDGKLVVLGYNGDIHLLSDSDGDGAEDKSELFWQGRGKITAPIGMDLAPKGTPHGDAVFFTCKGQVMMVTDRDGDGKAEEEKVIATGWPLAFAGVDTASVCYDPKDGSVLFGLGVRLYNNAYELDERGKAHNDLSSERGALLRIAPDFKSRKKICTGIRWPVGLRFNAAGDLFCTDQEGATWLPNGNPLDELLHIETDRHYGFPPQHPRHLPNVVDEPSVFDYGPQHQSTCGFRFNDSVNGGPHFGPDFWKGDALITGESRGKIYRTKLVKTAQGYVAQNQIVACMNQLAVDLAVSPRGDLLVAAHSGEPDWGTGPEGKGHIFRIRYVDKSLPQPRHAWSAQPGEFRVMFDKPLTLPPGPATVQRGPHVRAGDRHETMWPGYEVIKLQHAAPVSAITANVRSETHYASVNLSPQAAVEHFAMQFGPPESSYDVEAELTGVELQCGTRQLVMPHLDGIVNAALVGSSDWPDGETTLRTRLDLSNMLQPVVQPGSALDYEPPQEEISLWIASADGPFQVRHGFGSGGVRAKADSQLGQVTQDVFLTVKPPPHTPLDLEIKIRGNKIPSFQIAWHTSIDKRPRALPLRRFLLPWARPELTPGLAAPLPRPEIAGGDWKRGREVFLSDKALCSRCHAVRGKGSKIGPDLTNLTSRSYAAVLKDIQDPNAALNPDHVAHEVKLKDGRQFLATLRDTAAGRVMLGIGAGAELEVNRAEITSLTASKISLMPPKLDEQIGKEDLKHLMAFLLTEPPLMQVYHPDSPLPSRSQGEITAVLANPEPVGTLKPLKLLLVAGDKDHGIGEHDYPRWRNVWARLFSLADKVSVDLAHDWPTEAQWATADAVVFHRKGNWDAAKEKDFDAFLARGGGVTFIHWSLEAGAAAPSLARRLGLASDSSLTKYRHGEIELTFSSHPIMRGFEKTRFYDEMYWNLVPSGELRPLATAAEAGKQYPHAWAQEPTGGGRIFVTLGGHYNAVFDDPLFRVLLLRGIAWSAAQPVDRFNNLVEAGLEPQF